MRQYLQEYLQELAVDTSGEKTLALLEKLQQKHLEKFLFSSINVLLKKDLSLESSSLFKRVVSDKSGGYCFEHNKIFYELLEALGFKVRSILGRVLNNKDIKVPKTHRINLVTVDDETFLVDVGFGPSCPNIPLNISNTEQISKRGRSFRLIKKENSYCLSEKQDKDYFTYYSFTLEEAFEPDFEMGHFYSSHYEQAVFVNNLLVSKILENEICFLRNGSFHHIQGTNVEIVDIDNVELLKELMNEKFGIALASDEYSYLFQNFCLKN
jgi:N-hydroxyarylamine O-acetyltransferase